MKTFLKLLVLVAVLGAGYFLLFRGGEVVVREEEASQEVRPAGPASEQPAAANLASQGVREQGAGLPESAPQPPAEASSSLPAATAAPSATLQPLAVQALRLKNGKTVEGKVIIRDSEFLVIRSNDGETIQVAVGDLATP